jgi:hypothetical protein
MVKFFHDIEEKFDDFFKKKYVAFDKFYVKAKGDHFEGEARMKGDNTELKLKVKDKYKVQDMKFDEELTISSTGKHKFVGDWDLDKYSKDTTLKHTSEWNSGTNDHDTQVAVTYKGVHKTRLGVNFHYFKGGEWELTPRVSRKFCKGFVVASDFNFDGQKNEISSLNFGIFYKPTKWAKTWITHSVDGPINANTKWDKVGLCALRQRINAGNKTELGFDYFYDMENKSSSVTLGIEKEVASGVSIKSKVNSEGHIEASATLEVGDNWNVIIGTATSSGSIATKQECTFGIGLEGTLK